MRRGPGYRGWSGYRGWCMSYPDGRRSRVSPGVSGQGEEGLVAGGLLPSSGKRREDEGRPARCRPGGVCTLSSRALTPWVPSGRGPTGCTTSPGNKPSRYILPLGVHTEMPEEAASWLEKLSSLARRHCEGFQNPVWPVLGIKVLQSGRRPLPCLGPALCPRVLIPIWGGGGAPGGRWAVRRLRSLPESVPS